MRTPMAITASNGWWSALLVGAGVAVRDCGLRVGGANIPPNKSVAVPPVWIWEPEITL